jgi:hypothetical protein
MKRLLLAALLVSATNVGASAESYVCVADHSTGFKWNGNSWEPARFSVDRKKYVVTDATDDARAAGHTHIVKEISSNRIVHRCTRKTLPDGKPSLQMPCGGMGYGFVFNFETLRFDEIYTYGYVEADDSNDNTPQMTIGKCTKL